MNSLWCLKIIKENNNQLQLPITIPKKNPIIIHENNFVSNKENNYNIDIINNNKNSDFYYIGNYKYILSYDNYNKNGNDKNKKKDIYKEKSEKNDISNEYSKRINNILPITIQLKEESYFGDDQLKNISYTISQLNCESDLKKGIESKICNNSKENLKPKIINYKKNNINYGSNKIHKNVFRKNFNKNDLFNTNKILISLSEQKNFSEKENIKMIESNNLTLKKKNIIKKKLTKKNKKKSNYVSIRNNDKYLNYPFTSKKYSKNITLLDKTNSVTNYETVNNTEKKDKNNSITIFQNKSYEKIINKIININTPIKPNKNLIYINSDFKMRKNFINSNKSYKIKNIFSSNKIKKNNNIYNINKKIENNPFKYPENVISIRKNIKILIKKKLVI